MERIVTGEKVKLLEKKKREADIEGLYDKFRRVVFALFRGDIRNIRTAGKDTGSTV